MRPAPNVAKALETYDSVMVRRDLEAEDLADLVGLGHQTREVARAVAGLVLGVLDAGEVLGGDLGRVEELVDTDELGEEEYEEEE